MSRLQIRYSGKSHVGLKRSVNEDSILMLGEQQIFAVSDGMGGHAAGDMASAAVVDALALLPPDLDAAGRMQAVRQALAEANTRIHAEARRRQATIGATVVVLVLSEAHWLALWAGDSRLYRLRAGEIEMLTSDHSVVAELVLSGQLSWDEAEQHPQSNQITRAVGVDAELELDKAHGELQSGDRYLLCSDGLSRYAGFETLRRILAASPLETLAEELIQLALAGGGADNISLIAVDVL